MSVSREVKTMVLRENLSTFIQDQISPLHCYHFDAWLYQTKNNNLYFVIMGRRGGRRAHGSVAFQVTREGITQVDSAQIGYIATQGEARQIGSPWQRKYAPWLRDIHWPIHRLARLDRTGHGFKGPPSVKLWYIYQDTRIDDPLEGIENLYAVTGRQSVTAPPGPLTAPVGRPRSPWSKADRSVLRTLDKLLK